MDTTGYGSITISEFEQLFEDDDMQADMNWKPWLWNSIEFGQYNVYEDILRVLYQWLTVWACVCVKVCMYKYKIEREREIQSIHVYHEIE